MEMSKPGNTFVELSEGRRKVEGKSWKLEVDRRKELRKMGSKTPWSCGFPFLSTKNEEDVVLADELVSGRVDRDEVFRFGGICFNLFAQ